MLPLMLLQNFGDAPLAAQRRLSLRLGSTSQRSPQSRHSMLPAGFGIDGSQSGEPMRSGGSPPPLRGGYGDSSVVSPRPALDPGWAF